MSFLFFLFLAKSRNILKTASHRLFSYGKKCFPIHTHLPRQQTSKFFVARGTESWPLVRRYGGMKKKCPKAHIFEHLAPSWWSCLGMESSGGGALLEEMLHWGQTLKVYSLNSLPILSLLPVFGLCDQSASCCCLHAAIHALPIIIDTVHLSRTVGSQPVAHDPLVVK